MSVHTTPVIWTLGVLALLVLGLIVARLLAWVSAARERHKLHVNKTVIAEYDAPHQLSPAELGYILDAMFGDNELLATIAQLYAKQAVQLKSLSDKDFIILPTTEVTPIQVDDGESSVLGYLRTLPAGQISWSQLSSALSDVAGAQDDFESSVLQSLVGKGLLYPNTFGSMLFRKRITSIVLATLGTLAVATPVYIWGHGQTTNTGLNSGFAGLDRGTALLGFVPLVFLLWFVWFMYTNLLAYIYLRRDGVPVGATKRLYNLWPDVAGFRLFLQETEYVRLQHDRNPQDPSMAYCLALGLDPGFARSLKS